jgi:AcrR family transcriptional regulator
MAKRPDQLTERGDERRIQILRTALQLFADHGIEGVGLRQIAEKVGIAQPALYHYFASKDALVDAILRWRVEVNQQRLPPASAVAKHGVSLRQGLLGYLERFHDNFADPDNEAIHRIVFSELGRDSALRRKLWTLFVEPQMKQLSEMFAKLIRAGKVRDLDPDALAIEFLGPLLFAGLSGNPGPQSQALLPKIVFQHLEVFIRGIEP